MPIADKIITESQVKLLLRETAREKDQSLATGCHKKFINDYYMFALTHNTGLRVSELADLKWLDITDDYLVVRAGKGGRSRTVWFGPKTKALLTDLIAIRKPENPDDHLWLGQRGPLTRGAIHLRFKYWAKRLGLPAKLSMHSLRHAYATRCLNQGVDLASVRDLLGHSNIAVTSVYLHHTDAARDRLRRFL